MNLDALALLCKDDLIALVLARGAEIAALTKRVAALEAKLGQPPKTPDNSSLPPSQGHKPNRAERRAAKPRQGRPGVFRKLADHPDRVVVARAATCPHCAYGLTSADQPDFHAYDHIDLPVIRPLVTRVHRHRGTCPGCRRRFSAPVVAGGMAPGSPFGLGIAALIVHLHVTQAIGFERLSRLMAEVFGLAISEGAPRISRTGTPRGPDGARPEVWVADRYAAQAGHGRARQVCLAHLLRDAQFAIDAGDTAFAPGFKKLLVDACAIGRRRDTLKDDTLKDDTLKDATLAQYRYGLDRRLDRLLAAAAKTASGEKLARAIRRCRGDMFVFLARRDVPYTNNGCERALRPSVIFRKVTGCFRSEWGAQFYTAALTVIGTGRLNDRTPLQAIRDALADRPILAPP